MKIFNKTKRVRYNFATSAQDKSFPLWQNRPLIRDHPFERDVTHSATSLRRSERMDKPLIHITVLR